LSETGVRQKSDIGQTEVGEKLEIEGYKENAIEGENMQEYE